MMMIAPLGKVTKKQSILHSKWIDFIYEIKHTSVQQLTKGSLLCPVWLFEASQDKSHLVARTCGTSY
jgi:hypothetical protein